MRAELAKVRYLPLPRWTAAALAGVTLIVGAALLITAPTDAGKYVSVPNTAINIAVQLSALVFGVWLATLEFSFGTLTGEPDRNRVLTGKLVVILLVVAAGAMAIAAAGGGVTQLAATHAGIDIDDGDLAAALFGEAPTAISAAAIGFGFGLLARSPGGGIALGLVFLLVLDGFLSFIPGAEEYSYGQLSQDLSNNLTGVGETVNALAIALLGVLAWCVIVVAPGWMRFLRSDLKSARAGLRLAAARRSGRA
jgi:ABC-2 type transport system permease protein